MFHELRREDIEGKLVIGSGHLELLVERITLHLNPVLVYTEKFCCTTDDAREKTVLFAWILTFADAYKTIDICLRIKCNDMPEEVRTVAGSFPSVFILVGILVFQMQIAEGKRNAAISTGYIIRAGDTVVVWKNVAVFYKICVDIFVWGVFGNLYFLCQNTSDDIFTECIFQFLLQLVDAFSNQNKKYNA